MHTLLPYIRDWFLAKEEYFIAFANADSRLEGWFKAEMIVLLNRLKEQGHIDAFEREYNIPTPQGPKQRRQIDFRVHIGEQRHLCELKALCISQAAGTPRDLDFYFRDNHVGLVKDFKKLDELSGKDSKWVLGFVYPSPDQEEWDKITTTLANDLTPWQCVTNPRDFPKFVFISLWRQ